MPVSQDQIKSPQPREPKIALVHDFLVSPGGAERVLKVLADMYPEAPIYTLLHDPEVVGGFLAGRDIRTSFVQKFPRWLWRRYRWLAPLYPSAIEAMDLRDFDVVISSSGAWSKGIVTRLHTKHIAYIHSPMRFVWDYNERYLQERRGGRQGIFARAMTSWLRIWDAQAADRPDILVANSKYTQDRIEKYYRRSSEVLYPPITMQVACAPGDIECALRDTRKATNPSSPALGALGKEDYFLLVSRLTKAKRADIVVEAFNKLDLPLIVVGRGSELESLRTIARPNVRLVGWRSDEEISRLYRGAEAVVFPSEDDFGLVAAEALAYGTPVIAYASGGVREIVTEGVTGELFLDQTAEVLADGVRRFLERRGRYDTQAMHETVKRFNRPRFEQRIRELVAKVTK
jgi:glycosyltransferase involved in cell wall biosynthesis